MTFGLCGGLLRTQPAHDRPSNGLLRRTLGLGRGLGLGPGVEGAVLPTWYYEGAMNIRVQILIASYGTATRGCYEHKSTDS